MGFSPEKYPANITTIAQYIDDCRRQGVNTYSSASGWYWIAGERGSCVRFPTPTTMLPDRSEMRRLQLQNTIPLFSYIREPDDQHESNSYLYKIDAPYVFSNLKNKERRNAKKALASFRYEFIDWHTVYQHGYDAFRDTRQKVRLNDFSHDEYMRRMMEMRDMHGVNYLACWSGDRLAAYLAFLMFDDQAEGLLWCTNAAFIDNNPNNGLFHVANEFILNRSKMKSFCIGISSLQQTATFGQHRFRASVGFVPTEVHRVFQLHPFLTPVFGKTTLSIIEKLQSRFPNSREIRKMTGALSMMHGRRSNAIEPIPPELLEKSNATLPNAELLSGSVPTDK